MDVVARGDWSAIERGGLVMPAAESLRDLLVDAVAMACTIFVSTTAPVESMVTSTTTSPTRSRGSSERSTGGLGYTVGYATWTSWPTTGPSITVPRADPACEL